MFRKAQRKQAKLRLALAGPSGSGKTYSALLIAKGIGGRVAMIDTERRSGELYSHLYSYDVSPIDGPFDPQAYIDRIKAAEKTGYNVLIIDSLSHAWAGVGGILDIKDRIAKSNKNINDFTAWREATPKHNELVDTILKSSCHIIATLRTKTAYEVIQEEGKKAKVTKLGLAFVQREGLDYEFTVVLDLSIDSHIATSTKDRTGIFDGQYITPSEETGRRLLEWLNSGASAKNELIQQIDTLIQQLNLDELKNAYWIYAGNRYQALSIDQIDQSHLREQIALLSQCRQNPAKLDQFQKLLAELVNQQSSASDGGRPELAH
jgi:hypothetical protein